MVGRNNSQEREGESANKVFAGAAERLYKLGFNIVPVDSNKKPIGSWSSSDRLPWESLERRLAKAAGIAITGTYLEDPNYGVVVLDLDDVDVAIEALAKVFGEEWRTRLCGQGWSFCGLTGPRPKGRVVCNCNAPGEDCDCVINDTGEHRKLSELKRGMYVVIKVPKKCLPSGTVRSDAIEVMATNYEVVFGKHPSGVFYQPVRYADGKWAPIDIEDVGQGEVITCDELEKLIALIKQSTTNTLEELGKKDAKAVSELKLLEPTKELSEGAINQIINLIKPIWWLESDEGKHYHDIILYGLSSLMRRAGIKHEVAKRVVEEIINTGIRDIAGKVDQAKLQAIMRNEERHFRETVDYVYTKPTAKLWGKKAFEEALRPVIQRAIEQGLLNIPKPEDWFRSIYEALGLKHRSLLERILERRLPRTDIDVSKLPKWIWRFELKLDKCEDWYINRITDDVGREITRELKCTRRIRSITTEDSQYVLAVEITYKLEKERIGSADGEPIYNYHHKTIYRHVATLPRFMGVVYDPFYAEKHYVAFKDGRLYSVALVSDFESFIKDLMRPPFSAPRNKQYLELINETLPEVRAVISPGIVDDGFADPYGLLDTADYGIEPLLNAYEWIRRYYPESNAKWTWLNVVATLAKVITPIVRYHNRTFNDLIVYNVGRGGEGKSTLVRCVLLPMLGGEDARLNYWVVIDGPVKSDAQLRNLVDLNRLPLILDEQNKKALASNVGIFIAAGIGMGIIGIHAARYGGGIAKSFMNLRGMIVFTNIPFASFLKDVMNVASDYAIVRRFIEIPWDTEPISPNAFRDLPELKPTYGFASRLWQKYKGELIKSADLLELIEKLAVAIGREYMDNAKVGEIVRYTLDIVKELREMKRNERLALNDADSLVMLAYKFVGDELKTTQLTAVKVLRYLLENPQRAGIRLTTPRNSDDIDRMKTDLEATLDKYLITPYGIDDDTAKGASGKDPDAAALYAILRNAKNDDKVQVVLFARSPLIPGAPKEFLGARSGGYMDGGVKRVGYAIPLAELIRIFLTKEIEENKPSEVGEASLVRGDGVSTSESSGNDKPS
jgi:hypothetical protein